MADDQRHGLEPGDNVPEFGFEVPEADGAEQARPVEPEEPPAIDDPLPDEANTADVIEQRTPVPDGEDDGR